MIIADDDAIIRRGLAKNIDWTKYGIEVVGIASDGEEALEMINENLPDLLLTDIRMPFMDGIQLMNEVRKKHFDIQFILLTAYEEFEYAKHAIKNGACDYLLKPISNDKLIEAVLNAKESFEKRQLAKKQMSRSMPLIKMQFFHDVLSGNYSKEILLQTAKALDLKLSDEKKLVILNILVDRYFENERSLSGELLRFSVENVIKEVTGDVFDAEIFSASNGYIYVVLLDENEAELEEKAQFFAKTIIDTLYNVLEITAIIGISNVYSDLMNLSDAYKESCFALEYRNLGDKSKITLFKDVKIPLKFEINQYKDFSKEIVQKVITGNSEEAINLLEEFKTTLLNNGNVSIGNLHLWCIGLVAQIYQAIGTWSNVEVNYDYYEYSNMIYRMSDILQIFSAISNLICDISNSLTQTQNDSKQILVKKAQCYLEANFYKSELSLQSVAKEVHVTPVYLSNIFKQVLKTNFSDYLYELRIKTAKDLVENTDLKAYEIGKRVGYVNANYFYYLFKRKYKLSIGDYRKKLLDKANI